MTEPTSTPAGWYPVDGGQRYWDGRAWTDHTAPLASEAARRTALAVALGHQTAAGGVVAERGDDWAIVTGFSPGQKVSHWLHFVLSILTCFIWLPVWIFVAVTAKGPRRYTVRLDVGPDGHVRATELK